MFERSELITSADLAQLVGALGRVDDRVGNAERVEQLGVLERLKAAVAAAQARVTVAFVAEEECTAGAWRERQREASEAGDFAAWRRARDAAAAASWDEARGMERLQSVRRRGGDARSRRGVGVAAQVGLACRESPWRGERRVATSVALVRDLPRTFAALQLGQLSERRADIVARETAALEPELRALVDEELHDTLGEEVGRLGDKELTREVKAITYRMDAQAVVDRARGAENERRVTLRPAPDTMSYLSAYLPVAEGVAVLAALKVAAAAATATGDERGDGQVMADTLVTRVTGQADAAAVPVEIQLVMTDRALLGGDDCPAHVPGYGPVPAAWARGLVGDAARAGSDMGDRSGGRPSRPDVAQAPPPESSNTAAFAEPTAESRKQERAARRRAAVWVRRLFTHPGDGTLVGMDSTRRTFDGGLRRYVVARDGTCRTPWCDAPIRQVDHVVEYAAGGGTSAANGRGVCVTCNHARQAPGWRAWVTNPPGGRHTVELETPTGHRYRSKAPPVLPGGGGPSPLERALEERLAG